LKNNIETLETEDDVAVVLPNGKIIMVGMDQDLAKKHLGPTTSWRYNHDGSLEIYYYGENRSLQVDYFSSYEPWIVNIYIKSPSYLLSNGLKVGMDLNHSGLENIKCITVKENLDIGNYYYENFKTITTITTDRNGIVKMIVLKAIRKNTTE
jgi:hypothetical protein